MRRHPLVIAHRGASDEEAEHTLLAYRKAFAHGADGVECDVRLTADNHLVRMDSETRRASAPVRVSGVEGRLVGIDQRPANGQLYGLTDGGQIVTLDPMTGRATPVSRLSEPFESGGRAVVDFNPAADRIRVVSGTNSYRYNQLTGQIVMQDGSLSFASGGAISATGAAYTNNDVNPATGTSFLVINNVTGDLLRIDPPNSGTATSPPVPLPASITMRMPLRPIFTVWVTKWM